MKKTILFAIVAWSFSAKAVSIATLAEALNSLEVKAQLQNVSIQKIVELEETKCPGCSKISVQGTKIGILGSPIDYEMIFSTEYDFLNQKLNVTIDSETKN